MAIVRDGISSGETKERDRTIARNEEVRQVTGNIRVSVWAIAFAVIIGVVAVWTGWGWLHH
jgi:hypothetical protein